MTSANPRPAGVWDPARHASHPEPAPEGACDMTPPLTALGEESRRPACEPYVGSQINHPTRPGFQGSLLKLSLASWESQNLKLFCFHAFPEQAAWKTGAGVHGGVTLARTCPLAPSAGELGSRRASAGLCEQVDRWRCSTFEKTSGP